jgi:hypothetical protein
MRSRLMTNRHGKLTSDQWKDMVTEPLIVLLLLLVPLILFLGPRLLMLTARGIIFVWVIALIVVFVPMLFRARRYARAAVYFDRLYAGDHPGPAFLFWRPTVLYTEDGTEIRFKRRLAPVSQLRPNRAYLVYYLRDASEYVLLSMAPADHPDSHQWQPSSAFHERFARRAGR